MSTGEYRNWGRFIDDLSKTFGPVRTAVHKEHYGTWRYFLEDNLAIHRAFQAFCDKLSLDAAAVRTELIAFIGKYPPYTQRSAFRHLALHIPDEFNVRGVWTPEV